MTTDREMLETAAKACEIKIYGWNNDKAFIRFPFTTGEVEWNPLTSSADCAAMCAKLMIDTLWTADCVVCGDDSRTYEFEIPLDDDPEAAWRFAATQVAAMIGGMK